MAGPTNVPCPSCGKMNELTAKNCSTCGYAFVQPSEEEGGGSVVRRVVSRLVRR